MKILYLITLAEQGGGQVHVADLLHGFRERYDLTLATGEEGYLTDLARGLGIPVHVLPHLVHPIRPLTDARAVLETRALIRRLRPDLVHAHTSKAGLVGRLAARLSGVPAVFTAHTWAFAEGLSWQRKAVGIPAEWLAARLSARIIAVSDANRGLARSRRVAPAGKLSVVHNGVPDVPQRARPDREGTPTIVMVARLCPQKDHPLLIRALAGVNHPYRLLLVGDGPDRAQVEAEVRRLGIQESVQFLGARSDVAEILASASIFVLASNWEGLPLSILEAMRAGLPVIASDVGGVAEAVREGSTGFVVPAGDEGQLRARLQLLLADPGLRGRMGRAGRALYEAKFTREVMLRRTESVYISVQAAARSDSSKIAGTPAGAPVEEGTSHA